MTREEAKNWLNKLYARADITDEYGDAEDVQPYEEAIDMAIKALEQEPCEDAISRKAVINQIFYSTDNNGDVALGSALRERIARLPSVTPQEPNTWSLDDAREDFTSDVYNTLDFLPTNNEANRIIDSFDRVTSSIKYEPKTGHWIHFAQSDDCSECRWSTGKYISPSKYCPNCGAKMVEPQESER